MLALAWMLTTAKYADSIFENVQDIYRIVIIYRDTYFTIRI